MPPVRDLPTALKPAAPRSADPKEKGFEELKQRIHTKLVDKLDLSRVGDLQGDVLRREIRLVVEHLCDTEDSLLNRNERERLIDEVLDETFGLGPLEILVKDPTVSDILINGPKNIYVERRGKMEKTGVTFRDTPHLLQIIDRIVSKEHCIVEQHADASWWLKDLGALNGTYVNRERIDEARLSTGDEVQIGKFRLVFYAARS